MNRKTTHVVPNKDRSGWNVKQGGGERASAFYSTKREAVERAREISRNQGSELVIHKRDGKISESDSHGNDPHPPKG
jgi:hypothetical protein